MREASVVTASVNMRAGEYETALSDLVTWSQRVRHPYALGMVEDARLLLECIPHVVAAEDLQRDGRWQAAETEWRNAIRVDPQWPILHCYLGIALAYQGRQADRERECAEPMARRSPERPADALREDFWESRLPSEREFNLSVR